MTQRELAEKAMFVKAENLERQRQKPRRLYLLAPDGTRAYVYLPADKLGRQFPVFRDIGWYR